MEKKFNLLKIVENVTFPEHVQNAKRANMTKNIHKKSALISYRVSKNKTVSDILQKVNNYFLRTSIKHHQVLKI
jgi:hypothetical protein